MLNWPVLLQNMVYSNVAIVCPGLANAGPTMLGYVVLKCCACLAGALGVLFKISDVNPRPFDLGALLSGSTKH